MRNKNTETVTLGSLMCHLRKSKSLKQKDLSELTGVSRQTISEWERGNNLGCTERALGLLAVLGARLVHNSGAEHVLQLTVNKRLASAIQNSGLEVHQDG